MTAMQEIYRGEFRSQSGTEYRVELLTSETTMATSKELKFGGELPIEITWSEVDKLEPVQGSSMTLTLHSEEDREYYGLYRIETGIIRADVYRDGELYWSGVLDTELYEEPYSWKRNYEVSFTFSDFAVLDRKKWEKRGIITIEEVIETCVAAMNINYKSIREYISTKSSIYGDEIEMGKLYVVNDNFYDEDGEAMTMREVLEETLRPFGLRMVQKGGELHLYDLNKVYSELGTEKVWWKSDDAYLGVDSVYNNVKVTFSPYADTKLISAELQHDEVLANKESTQQYQMDTDWENPIDGFRIVTGEQTDLPMTLSNGAKWFRIDSQYSGSDECGVVWGYKGYSKNNYSQNILNKITSSIINGVNRSVKIISTQEGFLGYVSYNRSSYKLKVSLDVLLDVRYNPFETASKHNEEGSYQRLKDWSNFGYVPVMLYLKDTDGNILYHYENSKVMAQDGYKHTAGNCTWVAGPGNWGCMYLCYYDWDDRKSATGFGGWQTNKPIIGYYRDGLPKKWKTIGDGELIDLPPTAGYLELQVGSGIYQFDYKREEKDVYSIARWLMYKNPEVELVNNNGTNISLEDIEDEAWINQSAKEEITIETKLGTLGKTWSPSARGLIMDSNCQAYQQFARAGIEDRLERLLIGTVYSQYGTRHNTLSGTVRLLPEFKILTDESISGKYILLSEVQDLLEDSSEIKMVELSSDDYKGIEYK